MIKAILNGVMKLVTNIINIVLLPVNALIGNIFPNFSSSVSQFNSFVTNYVGGTISYFSSLLPPITRNVIAIWLTFLIVYYGVVWSYSLIVKIYNVIQKIKFW